MTGHTTPHTSEKMTKLSGKMVEIKTFSIQDEIDESKTVADAVKGQQEANDIIKEKYDELVQLAVSFGNLLYDYEDELSANGMSPENIHNKIVNLKVSLQDELLKSF